MSTPEQMLDDVGEWEQEAGEIAGKSGDPLLCQGLYVVGHLRTLLAELERLRGELRASSMIEAIERERSKNETAVTALRALFEAYEAAGEALKRLEARDG